jgi:hypothetical protein
MHSLTMFACSLPPVLHRAFIQSECLDNRLDWAAICQQDDHLQHDLRFGAQPIKNRPFCGGEGLLALIAEVSPFFLAMNTYVSSANLPSCRAVNIRAKYVLGVHRLSSWLQAP